MNRSSHLERLQTEEFDLCIIGGGASGAGCALDAALRGLKVALIEKTDFAAETSSKSTKLIHGGVRYLEQAFKKLDFSQLRQVRHGLEERYIVLHNAPHLAHPLALITPVFSWIEGLYFTIGLKLYGWFASGKDTLPPSRWLSKKETLQLIPTLSDKLHSAVLYYDGQLNDARYALALVQSAAEAGAVVVNHVEVLGFEYNTANKLSSLTAIDHCMGAPVHVRARQFLNCTGPAADKIRLMANPAQAPRIRPSKGVHAILPGAVLSSSAALLIPKTPDGRVVFAIPFEGRLLLGTTDEEVPDSEQEAMLEADELAYLLETLQPYIQAPLQADQVRAGYGGYRPLVGKSAPAVHNDALYAGRKTQSLLRDHEVEYDATSGLLSLLGGKWTTYRLMARDAVDAACQLLGVHAACRTQDHLLAGAAGYHEGLADVLQAEFGLDAATSRHFAQQYGGQAREVAILCKESSVFIQRLHPDYPYLCGELVYSARFEMACTLRDALARRLRLEIIDWDATAAVIEKAAELLGIELGWSIEKQGQEIAAYRTLIAQFKTHAIGAQDRSHFHS